MNEQRLRLALLILSGVVFILNLSHIEGSLFASSNLAYLLGALAMVLLAVVMGMSMWQGSSRRSR